MPKHKKPLRAAADLGDSGTPSTATKRRKPRREAQLTAMEVDKLKPRPARFTAFGSNGFAVRVAPSGTKTFVFVYRAGANKRTVTLGDYAKDYTLKDALADHAELVAARKRGTDPASKRKAERAAKAEAEHALAGQLSLEQLFDRWQETKLAPRATTNGKRRGRKDGGLLLRQQFDLHVFPRLRKTPARSVSKADVLAVIDKLQAEGKNRTADMVFASFRAMLRFAHDRELIERNPIATLEKQDVIDGTVPRTRALADWEIKRLLRRLPNVGLHPVTILALRFVLATGQRPGEVAGMSKVELDESQSMWTIPASRYKTGIEHTVPLSDHARDLLAQAAAYNAGSAYVFPSPQSVARAPEVPVLGRDEDMPHKDRPIDANSLPRSIKRKLGTATPEADEPAAGTLGLKPFVVHDLRRTARTGLAALGVIESVAERVLGHKLQGVAGIYNLHDYMQERRQALQQWGEHLDAML